MPELSKQFEQQNKQVSADGGDLEKMELDDSSALGIAREIELVLSDQDLPSISKAEKMLELTRQLREKQKEWEQIHPDMRRLTTIEMKHKSGKELSIEELRFLYEVDRLIDGYEGGLGPDPRVAEITSERNIKKDVSLAIGCSENEVSITQAEALVGGIKFHYGTIHLEDLETAEGLMLPEIISDGLFLNSIKSPENLVLPKHVGSFLNLQKLTSAEGLKLPDYVGSQYDLSSLTSAKGLVLPDRVDCSVCLGGLISTQYLKLPKYIGGSLYLNSLASVDDLQLPEYVGGLNLNGLTTAKNLKLPKEIGGPLYMQGLLSTEDLVMPEEVDGDIWLIGLKSIKGLKLPKYFWGNLLLDGEIELDDFDLESFGGSIIVHGMEEEKLGKFRKEHPEFGILG